MPDELKKIIRITDAYQYLLSLDDINLFDRVVLIEFLEHFDLNEGANLLSTIKPLLKKGGCIVVRVPNVASPWGLNWQYLDLTHKAAYTSGSLRQLGLKAVFDCKVFAQRRGNPRKQILENIFHTIITCFITERPEYWSANIVGHFQPE